MLQTIRIQLDPCQGSIMGKLLICAAKLGLLLVLLEQLE